MKKKTLKGYFKEYKDLSKALCRATFDYSREVGHLDMLPLHKDVYEIKSEEYVTKENELKQSIVDLENQITGLLQDTIKHIKSICKALKKENSALSEEDVKSINRLYHFWIEYDYSESFVRIELKRKHYSDVWDFSEIDFSEIEDEKEKLDSAIKEYNENNLKSVESKLQDVHEIREILKKRQDEFWAEQRKKMKKEQREFEAYYEKHKDDILYS